MHVFLKTHNWGSDNNVEIDHRHKYKIRSIGKKQAILDRIHNPQERERYRSFNRKGNAYYLTDPTVIENYRNEHPGEPLRSHHYESWLDLFAPAGDGDWDAEENYHWS